jgi:hypothetical protein
MRETMVRKYIVRPALPFAMLAVLTVQWMPGTAGAAQLSELPSGLAIAKSSNKNQVNYTVLVDDTCAPAGRTPVRPYWRMLERGPLETEPLSANEQSVLGVARQEVTGSCVQINLRGIPNRPITIETRRDADGRCSSSAEMTIAGVPATVASVYVKQRIFGIDYVLLTGRSEDGARVQERLSP